MAVAQLTAHKSQKDQLPGSRHHRIPTVGLCQCADESKQSQIYSWASMDPGSCIPTDARWDQHLGTLEASSSSLELFIQIPCAIPEQSLCPGIHRSGRTQCFPAEPCDVMISFTSPLCPIIVVADWALEARKDNLLRESN